MTTVPARELRKGDRVRVGDVRIMLTDVQPKYGMVWALGRDEEVFRWDPDHPVEREDG